MSKPPIAPETQALLDLILPPTGSDTTEDTDKLYALVQPLHEALAAAELRIMQVLQAVRKADAAEDNAYAYAFFEQIKQSVQALDREIKSAANNIDAATLSAWQLDRYARSMDVSLESHLERKAAQHDNRVILSKEEHAHLVERATAGDDARIELAKQDVAPDTSVLSSAETA